MPKLLLLIPLFALLDRWWGGGLKTRLWGHGLGKPAALLIFPAAYLIGLPWTLSLGLLIAFVVWRSQDMQLFGGDLAPYPDEYLGTFLRHAIAPAAFVIAFVAWKQSFDVRFLAVAPFPVFALLLAIWMRDEADEGHDVNATVELVRGLILGILVVGAIAWVS